jgi:hypothetical protein
MELPGINFLKKRDKAESKVVMLPPQELKITELEENDQRKIDQLVTFGDWPPVPPIEELSLYPRISKDEKDRLQELRPTIEYTKFPPEDPNNDDETKIEKPIPLLDIEDFFMAMEAIDPKLRRVKYPVLMRQLMNNQLITRLKTAPGNITLYFI